jgi:flagellar FliJ protein
MKKFDFKLAALLKLREFKEKKVKVELGDIVKMMVEIRDQIEQTNKDIDEGYLSQEKVLSKTTNVRPIQFYAYFFEGKRNKIIELEKELKKLEVVYEEKRKELATARGEVKVIENLRDKQEILYQKKYEKKLQENLEELASIRRSTELRNV